MPKPKTFPEVTKTLGKPPTMTDEECSSLPVFSDGQQCISLWQLSWRERLQALWHGHIWVSVCFGETQPPIALSVSKTVFEKQGDNNG